MMVSGVFLSRVNEASPVLGKFKTVSYRTHACVSTAQNVTAAGLFTMMRGHSIFTNPPLIVNESQVELSAVASLPTLAAARRLQDH